MLIHHKTSQIEILLHEGNNLAIPAVLVNKHLQSNCEFHRKSHGLQDWPRTKQIYIYTYILTTTSLTYGPSKIMGSIPSIITITIMITIVKKNNVNILQKPVLKLHRFGIVYSLGPWFPCCGWCFEKIAMLRVQQPILKLCWFYNVFSLFVSSITLAITFWPRQSRIWLPLYSHCTLSHHIVSIIFRQIHVNSQWNVVFVLDSEYSTIPHYTPIMVIYFR